MHGPEDHLHLRTCLWGLQAIGRGRGTEGNCGILCGSAAGTRRAATGRRPSGPWEARPCGAACMPTIAMSLSARLGLVCVCARARARARVEDELRAHACVCLG